MTRYSPAYSDLIVRMKEVQAIVSMARSFGQPTPSDLARSRTLGRSGVVLLCSHIEGYIEFLGNLAITRIGKSSVPKASIAPSFRYHLSRDLIDAIRMSTDPNAIAVRLDSLLQRDLRIWDDSTEFVDPLPVESFNRTFSTPRHINIRRFFGRFGYTNFERELASRLRENYDPCRNMVDRVVSVRNSIVHGDALAEVTPTELEEMRELVTMYCRNTDDVVGDWFKNKGCVLRTSVR